MTLIEKISKFFAHPRCDGPRDEILEWKRMKLTSFIQEEESRENEVNRHMAEYEKERQSGLDKARRIMFPCLRGANRVDYTHWLVGFVDAGNTPTHYYSYPFSRWNSFYVAKKDFELVPLYGADSINIIVPDGITILGGSRGHTNVFCYNGYKHRGSVPVFSDTVF